MNYCDELDQGLESCSVTSNFELWRKINGCSSDRRGFELADFFLTII